MAAGYRPMTSFAAVLVVTCIKPIDPVFCEVRCLDGRIKTALDLDVRHDAA
jgi:hypothetical protein